MSKPAGRRPRSEPYVFGSGPKPYIRSVGVSLADDSGTCLLALRTLSPEGVSAIHEYALRPEVARSVSRILAALADGRLPTAD